MHIYKRKEQVDTSTLWGVFYSDKDVGIAAPPVSGTHIIFNYFQLKLTNPAKEFNT